ncbi:MAG: acetyl-CoA carboxylase biotin carboxyl carrier protein subunit [Eubacterium sp.]|nr:acetyl-CoA carboxylase biotin carboxyl carrier protein subunit [Eubacterium sp.]
MEQQEIYELMSRFEHGSIQSIKISSQDFSIEMTKAAPAAPVPAASAVSCVPVVPVKNEEAEMPAITAPMVGTFYVASDPDQPPFVSVGDRVKKGQTVCLIEAMKMMSEIKAPCDCVIEEVVKEDGQLAAFGDALLRYRPC